MDKALYDRVKKNCEAFVKTGGRIVVGTYNVNRLWDPKTGTGTWMVRKQYDGEDCACAFGACLVVENPDSPTDTPDLAAADLLGVRPSQVQAFVEGFDAVGLSKEDCGDWYDAGIRMRTELGA